MDPFTAARREAEQWMGVAEKLLMARDFEGCKQFVTQALAADPRVPGAEDLLAAADALLAAQRRNLPSGHPETFDPYAVLGLDATNPSSRDPEVIHSHYRRLSLLLNRSHPDRPCSLAFAEAARIVADAWAFLSDPLRKAALDSDFDAAAAAAAAVAAAAAAAAASRAYSTTSSEQEQRQTPPPQQPALQLPPAFQPRQSSCQTAAAATPPSKLGRTQRAAAQTPLPPEAANRNEAEPEAPQEPFWTACPACCSVHQYDRCYEARTLLCASCRRPFFSVAMPAPPPIVPGTDMYYCSWGFFPLGFPGGPEFAGMVNSLPQLAAAAAAAFSQPYAPSLGGDRAAAGVERNVGAGTGVPVTAAVPAAAAPAPAKSMKIKVGARKRGRPKGSKNKKNMVIDINDD